MKTITNFIEEFKTENDNELVNNCMDILTGELDSMTTEDATKWIEDLQQHGCISGMVGALVYYADSCKFYEDNKQDINSLLCEMLEDTGLSIQELFGDKFDKEDPLCINDINQNLLAWFAFEETVNRFNNYMENDETED